MKLGRRTALSALLMTTLLASLLGAAALRATGRVAPALGATSVTTLPVLSGNGLNGPKGIAAVGAQVWVANNGNSSISLFNPDGTSAGNPISGNGLSSPYGLAVVGAQVWLVNPTTSGISRFNPDGRSAGAGLTGNGPSRAKGISVVGIQVWVSNGHNTIHLFNPDCSSAGS